MPGNKIMRIKIKNTDRLVLSKFCLLFWASLVALDLLTEVCLTGLEFTQLRILMIEGAPDTYCSSGL